MMKMAIPWKVFFFFDRIRIDFFNVTSELFPHENNFIMNRQRNQPQINKIP